eukprot:4311256-Amphidinium_carterae.1
MEVANFDRDTTILMENLRKLAGNDLITYRLKVQTSGMDSPLSEREFWKCEIFPCKVRWREEGKVQTQYLSRSATDGKWRLASCVENWGNRGRLTKAQKEVVYDFSAKDIQDVVVHVDRRSQDQLYAAKTALKHAEEVAAEEGLTLEDALRRVVETSDEDDAAHAAGLDEGVVARK